MSTPKAKILCLEDDKSFLDIYKELFSDEYDVFCSTNLNEAERILDTQDIRFVIIDISLIPNDANDTSGFKFFEKLISLGLIADLPTIIVTAHEKPEYIRKAFRDFGVRDFFSKDKLNTNELVKTIDACIAETYPSQKSREVPRALVLDDEAEWREILKELLESEGCKVDVASTYEEAINKISKNIYHLATIDIRLNAFDKFDSRGMDLLEMVKRIGLSIDSILVSAVATKEQVAWALTDLNVRDFVGKDEFGQEYFRRRIRRLLSRLIYINISFKLNTDYPIMKVGQAQLLTVEINSTRSESGISRSLARPVTTGKFELEVVVHPYDVDVTPGSTQILVVGMNDTAEPLQFTITPTTIGRIELVIDLYYRANMLARITIPGEAVE